MNSMARRLTGLLLLLCAASLAAQVDPWRDIKWPTCTSLQAYNPATNTCFTPSGGTGGGGSLTYDSGIQSRSGWIMNHDAGTSGTASGVMTQGISSPSISGNAAQFDTTFTASGGEIYYNAFNNDTAATNFFYDAWVYIPSSAGSTILNLETDMNQVLSNGDTIIYGIQCDGYTGTWDYTKNSGTAISYVDTWVHSTQPCNPSTWTKDTWHHLQYSYSRDNSENVTYSSIWFDGALIPINQTVFDGFTLGWTVGTLLTNFQIDGNGSGSNTVYLDNLNIGRGTGGGGGGAGGISGSGTINHIPKFTGAGFIGDSALSDDGVNLTSSEPIIIAGPPYGVVVNAGTAATGAAGKVVYASDATNGYAEVNENNGGLSRVCTAANGICAAGSMVYPGAGVPNSTGTAWGTSYSVGSGASNLVQLNGSSQLPAVSGVNLTSMTASQVGLGSLTNDAQTKNSIVPNSFSGLRFGNGGTVDTAATSAQVQSAIGAGVYDASGTAAARAVVSNCSSGQYATGTGTSATPCAQVGYSQLSGTPVTVTLLVAGTTHKWVSYIDASGVQQLTQPAFSDLSGNIAVSQMNSGTSASSGTFWRGDGTWASVGASMVYPGAGVPLSTGSAWATSYTAPTGNLVGTGQANTYTTGLQDFSVATMKLPSSVSVGANSVTLPALAGTVALTSQLPATKTAASGQPLLSYDAATGLFTQAALTATNVGLGSVTNDAQTKNSIVPNSFAGIRFGNSGSIDTAATSAQVQTVIGAGVYDASGAAAARAAVESCTNQFLGAVGTTGSGHCATVTSAAVDSSIAQVAAANTFTATQTITKAAIATTPTDGLIDQNTTASTLGATLQYSPAYHIIDHAWKTGAAADDQHDWRVYGVPTSGASTTDRVGWFHQVASGGYSEKFSMNDTGIFSAAAGFVVNNAAPTTGHYLKSDGTKFVESSGSASGTGTPTACTNQAVTGFTLNADAAPTSSCSTLTSAFVDTSIAKTGTDINTSNQVTVTHLAAALPINQGGTAATAATGSGNVVLATSPSIVTPTFTTSATTPIIYGGTAAGSTLTLNGTSNGSPSNAYLLLNPAGGGNVGIGTATPNQTLEVDGWGRFDGNGGANYSDSGAIEFYNAQPSSANVQAQIKALRGLNDFKAGEIGFYTAAATTGTLSQRMVIDEAGFVGIGIQPFFNLDVNGTIRFSAGIFSSTCSGYFKTDGTCSVTTNTGTINSAAAWSPSYYPATGTAISGVTPFTGFEYYPGSAAPQAATATNLGALVNLATSAIPKSGGTSAALTASSITDDGVTITTSEPIVAGNTVLMAAAGTVTSTSFVAFTTNTLALPVVPASTKRKGSCDILWNASSTSTVTPTFALNTSATSTGFWILGSTNYPSTTAVVNFLPPTAAVTTATQTAFTAALAAASTSAWYRLHVEFALSTNANAQTITVYAKVAAGTLTIEPGSSCAWLP